MTELYTAQEKVHGWGDQRLECGPERPLLGDEHEENDNQNRDRSFSGNCQELPTERSPDRGVRHPTNPTKYRTMSEKKKLSKKQQTFIEVFRIKNGHITKACEASKIHRSTYYEWMKDELFADEIDAVIEEEVDRAEEMSRILREGIPEYKTNDEGEIEKDGEGDPIVIGWIEKPDARMIKHFLESKGKQRGYGKQLGIDLHVKEMPKNVSIGLTVHKKK